MSYSNVIIFSDTHFNSRAGLMPNIHQLESGQVVKPNSGQLTILNWWYEIWNILDDKTKGQALVICNGDAVHGIKKKARLVSGNDVDMCDMTYQMFKPIRDKYQKFVMIKGTEWHVATYEETIARRLKLERNAQNQASRFGVRIRMDNDAIIDVKHHGPVNMPNTKGSMHIREWNHCNMEKLRQSGQDLPDMVVRSHGHSFAAVWTAQRLVRCRTVTTPAFCLLDEFAFKSVSGRNAVADVGMIHLYIDEDDMIQIKPYVMVLDPLEEEFV